MSRLTITKEGRLLMQSLVILLLLELWQFLLIFLAVSELEVNQCKPNAMKYISLFLCSLDLNVHSTPS